MHSQYPAELFSRSLGKQHFLLVLSGKMDSFRWKLALELANALGDFLMASEQTQCSDSKGGRDLRNNSSESCMSQMTEFVSREGEWLSRCHTRRNLGLGASAAQPLLLLFYVTMALCQPGCGLSSLTLIKLGHVRAVLMARCGCEGVWCCGWGPARHETGLGKNRKEDPP